MVSETVVKLFSVAIAWDWLWVYLSAVPFFKKPETLYKDYISDGRLDTALSFIETHKLIPALVEMFTRARAAQPDRRKHLGKKELQQILQEVDYIPDLKRAQNAMNEIGTLERLFELLKKTPGGIWKWSLFHALMVLCIPISNWIPDGYEKTGMAIAILLALLSFFITIKRLCGFHKNMTTFLELLQLNREKGYNAG